VGIEIERKFLVKGDAWKALDRGKAYRQGYLSIAKERTVRVRTVEDHGYITIKGPPTGASRAEYEYSIPIADAHEMLDRLCERPLIEKVRRKIPYKGLTWEVDEFAGENAGLIVAEVELTAADQHVDLPDWVGQEVTEDRRYSNSSLVKNPYSRWSGASKS